MDNNLINVDDLIRNRLTGGEEREPSGAWLRMQALLDKEEDRKPVAFFWRRWMGGLAILVLLGFLSLGGYQLATKKLIADGATDPLLAVNNNASGDHTSAKHNTTAPASAPDAVPTTDNNKPSNNKHKSAIAATTTTNDRNSIDNSKTDKKTNKSIAGLDKQSPVSHKTSIAATNTNTTSTSPAATSTYNKPTVPATNENRIASVKHNHLVGNNPTDGSDGAEIENTDKSNPVPATNLNGTNRSKSVKAKTSDPIATLSASSSKKLTVSIDNKVLAAAPSDSKLPDGINENAIPASTPSANTADKKVAKTTATSANSTSTPSANSSDKKLAKTKTTNTKNSNPKPVTNDQKNTLTTNYDVATTSTSAPTTEASKQLRGELDQSEVKGHRNHKTTAPSGIAATTTKPVKNTGTQTAKLPLASATSNATTAASPTGLKPATVPLIADKKANKALVAKSGKTGTNKSAATLSLASNKPVKNSAPKPVSKPTGTGSVAIGSPDMLPTTSNPAPAKIHGIAAKKNNTKTGTTVASLPLASGSVANVPSGTSATNAVANKPSTNNKPTGAKQTTNNTVTPTNLPDNTGKAIASINTPDKTTTGQTALPTTPNPAVPARKNKIMQRITIHERMMHSGGTTHTRLDTISIETINEEFAINDDTSNDNAAIAYRAALSAKGLDKTEDLVIPVSPVSDEEIASAKAAKKKGNGHTMESLQNAMNDIKYKISGAQFAMGLKAGVNGTFFGPSTFKGFQFGITSNFIISESVNLMAELEYFHRINNDYMLTDKYFAYTQLGPDLWSKQQMAAPYSFSTLHSFELPLIFRYTKGRFNFYGGMNMVYTFAVNQDAGLAAATSDPSFTVQSVSNDNAPKIHANDFDARFGVGYLFGISVQLSQEFSLDARNVNTFWDNSGTSGAKEVSSQIYKSPSLQLSIGYRLGGKRGKDKE